MYRIHSIETFFAAGHDRNQVLDVLTILASKTLSNDTNLIAPSALLASGLGGAR